MENWLNVKRISDATPLDEDHLGLAIDQLRHRTDILKSRLDNIKSDNSLRMFVSWGGEALGHPRVVATDGDNFRQADLSVLLESSTFSTLSPTSYAAGIARSTSDGVLVTLYGMAKLSDAELDDIFNGVVPTHGPVYLDPIRRGCLTAHASGPSILVGLRVPGGVIVMPQFRDIAEAHMHRTFALPTRVAGETYLDGSKLGIRGYTSQQRAYIDFGEHIGANGSNHLDTGGILSMGNYVGLHIRNVTKGTEATVVSNNETTITTDPELVWDTGDQWTVDQRVAVIPLGGFRGSPCSYDLVFTDATGVVELGRSPKSNSRFEEVYVKWISTDPAEGSGISRVFGYGVPLQVGLKGLQCLCENLLQADFGTFEEEAKSLLRRTVRMDMPDDAAGWRAHATRSFEYVPELGLRVFHEYTGPKARPTKKLVHGPIKKVEFSTVQVGNVYSVGDLLLEIVGSGAAPTTEHAVAVPIDDTALELTLRNMAKVLRDSGVPAAYQGATLYVSTSYSFSVVTGASVSSSDAVSFSNQLDMSSGITLMVHDEEGEILSEPGNYRSYERIQAGEDAYLYLSAYTDDFEFRESITVISGFTHTLKIINDGHDAGLVRNADMDYTLYKYFPPVPMSAAGAVLAGKVLRSDAIFPEAWDIRTTLRGIYLHSDMLQHPAFTQLADSGNVQDPADAMEYHVSHARLPRTSIVTSVRAADGSPIIVRECGGDGSSDVGDLELDLALELAERYEDLDDYTAFKRVRGNQLVKAPVVSRISAGPGVSLISPPGVPAGTGHVILSSAGSSSGTIGSYTLKGARQERIGPFPYIQLLPASPSTQWTPSGFTFWIKVPDELADASGRKFYVQLGIMAFPVETPPNMGPSNWPDAYVDMKVSVLRNHMAGTHTTPGDSILTDLETFEYRRMALRMSKTAYDPTTGLTGTQLPGGAPGHTVGQFYLLNYGDGVNVPGHSPTQTRRIEALPVAGTPLDPGDLIGFEISRTHQTGVSGTESSDSVPYYGGLGVMEVNWKLESAGN